MRAYPLVKGGASGQEGLVSQLYHDTQAVPSRKTTYGSPGRCSRASRTTRLPLNPSTAAHRPPTNPPTTSGRPPLTPSITSVDERPEIFYITQQAGSQARL